MSTTDTPDRLPFPEAVEVANRHNVSRDMLRKAVESGHLRAFQPNPRGLILVERADLMRWLNRPAANPQVTPTFRTRSGEVLGGGRLTAEADAVLGRPIAFDPDFDETDEDGFPLDSGRPAFAPEVRLTTSKQQREEAARRRALQDGDAIPTVDGL